MSTKAPHKLSLRSCWARGIFERSAAYVGMDTFIALNDFFFFFCETADDGRGVPRADVINEVGATYVPGPGVTTIF